jgi:hypothetical protein
MRVLFLDFDGVLHPLESASLGLQRFCWLPILDSLLNGHADLQIVIHSTWRYEYTEGELKALLGPLGSRFAGCVPRGARELAIETVLQANKSVQHHLVLDDDSREFSGTVLNLLLLDPQRGISDAKAQAAVREWLLSSSPPETSGALSD